MTWVAAEVESECSSPKPRLGAGDPMAALAAIGNARHRLRSDYALIVIRETRSPSIRKLKLLGPLKPSLPT